jgi:Ca-activated chloride channel family protein
LIGYETRMLRREDFNNDAIDAGEIGAGHSVTAIYEIVPATADPDRLMTVKLRYKAPGGDVSKLTSTVIFNRLQPMTANLGFASAVAEAGMVLRDSKYVKGGGFASAISRAKRFRGDDAEGYRAEFIKLMELAAAMPKSGR